MLRTGKVIGCAIAMRSTAPMYEVVEDSKCSFQDYREGENKNKIVWFEGANLMHAWIAKEFPLCVLVDHGDKDYEMWDLVTLE